MRIAKWFIVGVAVLVGLLASACFGPGTFRVGTDIQPGTYRNSDSSGGCYWERLSGFGGTLDEIIANESSSSPQVVTIAPGDVGFSSSNCGVWTLVAPVEPAPTVVPTAIPAVPSAVDRWNACEITWVQGIDVEESLELARISGSSTKYLSRQYDILQSYVETNCRGIGSTLALEPKAASICWKMLDMGVSYEEYKDLCGMVGDTCYFANFGLVEVDAFIRAVGC